MKRRTFLAQSSTLVGLVAAAAGVRASAPGPAPQPPATPREIELQRAPVAGFQYHQGGTLWPSLQVGEALDLVREPDNAYDPRAVRVEWRGRKLGYLPRLDNAAASQLLDRGHRLRAEILHLRDSHNPWERVEFAVFLVERA